MWRLTTLAVTSLLAGALLVNRLPAQQPKRSAPPPSALLGLFDADRDGALSSQEIDGAAARLRALDTSKDGRLTADELPRGGPPGRGGFAQAAEPDLQRPLLPKDDAEKKAVAALGQAQRGMRFANVSTADGRLLRQLTEAIGARRVVEFGTSTGESGIWFALALRKTGGHLYTHEINPERIATARQNFQRAGVDDLITIIEGDGHQTVKQHKDPVDVVFIDADKEGYADYLKQILPLVRPGGLILAHNMRRPPVHPAYLEAITTDPDLDTSFVLLDGAGIGITLKKH
jgi:predicted O-methyltransferase YrrM